MLHLGFLLLLGHSFSPNSYNGKTVKGALGSSVNFTWTFSGHFTRVDWGLAADYANFHSSPQLLLSILKSGLLLGTPPSAYSGRVSGKLTGNQVMFTLKNITKNDERLYGCMITDITNVDDIPSFNSVNFEVEREYNIFIALLILRIYELLLERVEQVWK